MIFVFSSWMQMQPFVMNCKIWKFTVKGVPGEGNCLILRYIYIYSPTELASTR